MPRPRRAPTGRPPRRATARPSTASSTRPRASFLYDTQDVVPVPNSIAGYKYNLNYPFARFFYPMHPAQ